MTARINITLSDEELDNLLKCYKQFIATHDWKGRNIPTLTGYTASIVVITINRILDDGEDTKTI